MTDVLSLLAYCFCGYAAFLVVFTIWKNKAPDHAAKWMKFLARIRKPKGTTRLARVWELALALTCCTLLMFSASLNRWPEAEHHNLRIERHPSDRQWWIVDDEDPQGFMYYACADFPNDEYIKAGYWAKRARWQVRGGCNSIKADGYGFFYEWKPDGTAVPLTEHDYHAMND